MGNKKYSLLSMVSSVFIVVFAIGSLVSINIDIAAAQNAPPVEGLDFRDLSIGLMTVMAVLALIYGGISLVGAILKLVHALSELWGFTIPAMILDFVLLMVNVALLVNATGEGDVWSGILSFAVTMISVFSMIMSGKSIAMRNKT